MNIKESIRRALREELLGVNQINVYHVSLEPITNIDNRFLKKQTPRDKPEGIWFTYEPNKWKDYFYSSDFKNLYKYKLTIDNSNFLILDTIEKINEFNQEYKSDKPLFGESYGMIWTAPDWKSVKMEYDGVEFPNYEKLKNDIDMGDVKNHWLTFIDVDSGCVWNNNVIKNIKEI